MATETTAVGSKDKISRAATMLRQLHLWDDRALYLENAYGVSGLRQMADWQLDDLTQRLRADVAAKLDAQTEVPAATRKLRSSVLTILTAMGRGPERGWAHVNEYLCDRRIAGKVLYALTDDELKALVKKLRVLSKKSVLAQEVMNHQKRWN